MTEHEKFKNIADGIQSLLIGLAVIVGGLWALFQFSALQRVEQANMEVLHANAELVRIKAETENLVQKNSRQGVLEININAHEAKLEGSKRIQIIGTVSLKNIGTRNVQIDFPKSNPPLTVSRVRYNSSTEQLKFETIRRFKFSDYEGTLLGATVLVGRELTFPFMVEVDELGMYMVGFRAFTRNEDDEMPKDSALHSAWEQNVLVNINGLQPSLQKENLTLRSSGTAQKRAAP